MKIPFQFFIALFLFLLLKVCPALSQQIKFIKVAAPLINSGFVGGIVQDKNGYIWLATSAGLFKYDGYRFRLYTNDPTNENSPASIRLETVYADRKGIIWIATWINGLDRFDPTTSTFTHFRHDSVRPGSLSNDTVRSILEDQDGTLWIGTNSGLDRYDPKTNKFYNYHHDPNDPNSLSCNRIRKLYEDKEGAIWIGTGSVWGNESGDTDEGGLNRFDKKTGKFIRYLHDPKNAHSLINNKIQAILEDSRGTFWVGSAGDGLHTMDRKTGIFERHLYDPAHPEKLSRPALQNSADPDHITSLAEDVLGNIWIGTLGNGISRYDRKTGKIAHYSSKDTAIGFTGNSAWTFYSSRDGVLWIGTFRTGLYRVDPYHKNIPYIYTGDDAISFTEDDNNLWIGTVQGLILQHKNTGAFKKFLHDPLNPNSISNDIIFSLLYDKEDLLWIGTLNGLNRFNKKTNTFTRYVNNPNDSTSIGTGGIGMLVQDAGGDSLWVGTESSLDLMNKQTGTFKHFRSNPRDTNSLTRNSISALLRDKSGNLWIGAFPGGGLNYLDCSTGRFKHFLKGLSIYSLLESSSGNIWIGTEGSGLYMYNKDNGSLTKFNDPGSGIENAAVLSIQEDDQGNICISSSLGIYRINPRAKQSTLFGAGFGVNFQNVLNFVSSYKGKDGKIYFGNASGYYIFSPNEITNTASPEIILTDLRIGGKSVIVGKNALFTGALEKAEKITLSYNQSTIALDFAAIHYSDPENNRHLYKLENYDPDWREANAEKTAYYFNLPPGNYIFKIKASGSEGKWAEKSIAIIISPPWWRTWWAYCVYGLLFIALAYSIHRFQKERLIKAERERTREKELIQAKEIEKAYQELKAMQTQLIQQEKMASLGELTAGIAHEIQNPLNFVNNFSEVSAEMIDEWKEESAKGNEEKAIMIADDVKQNLEKIIHHGKRADAIVKGMLQHSRVNTGQKEPTDINALADEYLRLSYHGLRAKDPSFNAALETDYDKGLSSVQGNINIIPQDIGRVLLNLYNNAFYAVAEKNASLRTLGPASSARHQYDPTVWVSTKKINGKVEIKVKDNGNGIPQKVLDKIFQPFFTTKPTGQGTGLGLSLSYDIIKAHGGELKVETEERKFAEFIIRLPLNENV